MDNVLDILDQGSPVDILYFDFKKAFDRVPYNRLLLKLKCLGIEGKLLNTVKDFLTNRTFRVCVEGQFSNIKEVLSGIPQGSVLGPLLFVLYINDLPDYVKKKAKLFADDLKLIANAANRKIIDDDLRKLEQWERTWLLEFNLDKCKVMHLDFNNNQKLSYILDNTVLESCEQEKDLGVLTSVNLLWNDHISSFISKANQMICWIARSIISREKSLMLRVYKTLVRPHLEYCVQLWNPLPEHGNWAPVIRIESIQRRFTRMIDDIGLLPYSERLEILGLTTLIERRARGDLINFGRSGINLVSQSGESSETKVKNLKRHYIRDRTKCYWNKLPNHVKNASSLNIFKNALDNYKNDYLCSGFYRAGNYWDLSYEVLNRIEDNSYLDDKQLFNEYLKDNPFVAQKKLINIH